MPKTTKPKAKAAPKTKVAPKAKASAKQEGQQNIPSIPITIHGQYIKDLSFEIPDPFMHLDQSNENPTINLNVEVKAGQAPDNRFAVDLHVTAEATQKKKQAFLLELTYTGIFSIGDVPEEALPPVLLVECPRLLFPFARSIVANVTREGGFPPLSLTPIDFFEIYRRQLEARQAEQAKAGK